MLDMSNIMGINLTQSFIARTLVQCCDVYSFFNSFDFFVVLNNIGLAEASIFASPLNRSLREGLIGQPGIGPFGLVARAEQRGAIPTNKQARPAEDRALERDSVQVPITALIWVTAHIIAFSPTIRANFTMMAANYEFIPSFFVELLKRIRWSTLGSTRIVTKLIYDSWDMLVQKCPELKGTFWDPQFLETNEGMIMYLGWLQLLAKAEGNYIPMTTVAKDSLPMPESGVTTTYGAIGKLDFSFLNSTMIVLNGHSFSKGIVSSVQLVDAHISQTHYRTQGDVILTEPELTLGNLSVKVNASLGSMCNTIVMRVAGQVKNQNRTAPARSDSRSEHMRQDSQRQPQRDNNVKQNKTEPKSSKIDDRSLNNDSSLAYKMAMVILMRSKIPNRILADTIVSMTKLYFANFSPRQGDYKPVSITV